MLRDKLTINQKSATFKNQKYQRKCKFMCLQCHACLKNSYKATCNFKHIGGSKPCVCKAKVKGPSWFLLSLQTLILTPILPNLFYLGEGVTLPSATPNFHLISLLFFWFLPKCLYLNYTLKKSPKLNFTRFIFRNFKLNEGSEAK